MTREIFQAQMERMSFLFDRPPMKAGAMEAWYPNFVTVEASVLNRTLDRLITTFDPTRGERYPSLATILKALSGKPKNDTPQSCVRCAAGIIRFEFCDKGMGKVYERIAACDCAAGDRRTSVSYPKGKMRRYSSMFSIDSAQCGFGVSMSKPPTKNDADDGKGESYDPDRTGALIEQYTRQGVV